MADEMKISGNLTVTGQSNNPTYTIPFATSVALNFNNGATQQITLTANDTEFTAPSNAKDGATYWLLIKQDATGGNNVLDWASAFQWPNDQETFSITQAGNSVDLVRMKCVGSTLYCRIYQDHGDFVPPA